MAPDEFTRAGERIQEQIVVLGELRNAGPRDQRFKLWRQNTLTLLQRLWPSDPSRAERFRRIPFSAPPTRSDREGMRHFFARGCKEAATYLNSLAVELGAGGLPIDLEFIETGGETPPTAPESAAASAEATFEMPSIAEAPAAPPLTPRTESEPEPPRFVAPEPAMTQAAEPAAPPPVPRKAASSKPTGSEFETAPISFLSRSPKPASATPTAKQGPAPRRTDPGPPVANQEPAPNTADAGPPPAMPAQSELQSHEPPARKKSVGMRLKDMLGLAEHEKSRPAEPPAHESMGAPVNVTPPEAVPPPVARTASVPPAASTPHASVESAPPPAPDHGRDIAAEFILGSPVLQAQARPLRRTGQNPQAEEVAPAPAQPARAPASAAPAPPQPARVPVSAPAPQIEPARGPVNEDSISPAAQEVYDLAIQIDELGVSPQLIAIMRATLIDLGRQMETPPVGWEALRETVSLAMEHPELARRLMPIVLPYFDQAA